MVDLSTGGISNSWKQFCGGGLKYTFTSDKSGGQTLASTEVNELSLTSLGRAGISVIFLSGIRVERDGNPVLTVQSVKITPLVIGRIADGRGGVSLGSVRPVQMTLRMLPDTLLSFFDSEFFNWANKVPASSNIKLEVLNRDLSSVVITYDFECVPLNWDGFWLTNGDVEETVVAECQVLSINNVSDPELPNWFTEVLNGTDLDGHRDITIEFSDSGGNNLGLNVYGRSLPS